MNVGLHRCTSIPIAHLWTRHPAIPIAHHWYIAALNTYRHPATQHHGPPTPTDTAVPFIPNKRRTAARMQPVSIAPNMRTTFLAHYLIRQHLDGTS